MSACLEGEHIPDAVYARENEMPSFLIFCMFAIAALGATGCVTPGTEVGAEANEV